jgi:poly-gamma-glutamate capsule biosynthesis protein CapA/YwtB (metallophosphatase superfamily)
MDSSNGGDVSLFAVGDVMLARRVGQQIIENGVAFPFLHVEGFMRAGDIRFGNLESSLARCGSPRPVPLGDPLFRGLPEAAQSLKQAGFDVISLANNHVFDYGEPAFRETLATLRGMGIRTVGAGLNIEEALEPVILRVCGNRVAFQAFCNAQAATATSPGTAPLEMDVAGQAIRDARRKADWVVVAFHQGLEYSDYPSSGIIAAAHQMIDAGADVVLGHHAHVLQGIERYAGGLVAYSLGNFVFDHHDADLKQKALARSAMARVGGCAVNLEDNRMAESIILRIVLSSDRPPSYVAYPVHINEHYQPVLMEQADADRLLKRLNMLSASLSGAGSTQVRAVDSILLRDKIQKLWQSPSGIVRVRPRHLKRLWRLLIGRGGDRSRSRSIERLPRG